MEFKENQNLNWDLKKQEAHSQDKKALDVGVNILLKISKCINVCELIDFLKTKSLTQKCTEVPRSITRGLS